LHTADGLLDAAVDLFAADGARGVTMSGVARAAGAPSGSVYHRFPDRAALLAALWRRTVDAFGAAYDAELGDAPDPAAAVRAARWVVEWCRREPSSAAILHAGPSSFEPDSWSPADRDAHALARKAREAAMSRAIASVARQAGVRRDEAAFAMVGLPLAVVGQHLRVSEVVPAGAGGLVERLAARLLGL